MEGVSARGFLFLEPTLIPRSNPRSAIKLIYIIDPTWQNKVMKTTFLLFILGFFGISAPAYSLNCQPLSGVWEQQETEMDQKPVILSIAADCRITLIQAMYQEGDTPLKFEFLFEEKGRLRVQYGVVPGARGTDGEVFPDPLPEDLLKTLRGNVYQLPDGSLKFSLDILDELCGAGPERCVSSPFVRKN